MRIRRTGTTGAAKCSRTSPGLLESLTGGLRAPDCPLIAPRADGSVALWLEDLRSQPATAWPVERYGVAARHLGQMQGAFAFRTRASRSRLVEPRLVAELSAPTRRRPGAPRSDRALEPSPPRTVVPGPAGRPPPRDAARSTALPGRARCAPAHAVSSRPAPGQPLRRRRRRLDDRDRLVIRRHRCDRRRRGQPRARRSARLPCRDRRISTTCTRPSPTATRPACATPDGRDPTAAVRLGMAATIAAKYAWIAPAMLRADLRRPR